MFSTHAILTPGACWEVPSCSLWTRSPGSVGSGASWGSADELFLERFSYVLEYFVPRAMLRRIFIFTLSYPSHLKPIMVLKCFLDNDLPKTLSQIKIPLRRSMKKSKKHQAIARAARGGCGGLDQLWEALAELGARVCGGSRGLRG